MSPGNLRLTQIPNQCAFTRLNECRHASRNGAIASAVVEQGQPGSSAAASTRPHLWRETILFQIMVGWRPKRRATTASQISVEAVAVQSQPTKLRLETGCQACHIGRRFAGYTGHHRYLDNQNDHSDGCEEEHGNQSIKALTLRLRCKRLPARPGRQCHQQCPIGTCQQQACDAGLIVKYSGCRQVRLTQVIAPAPDSPDGPVARLAMRTRAFAGRMRTVAGGIGEFNAMQFVCCHVNSAKATDDGPDQPCTGVGIWVGCFCTLYPVVSGGMA